MQTADYHHACARFTYQECVGLYTFFPPQVDKILFPNGYLNLKPKLRGKCSSAKHFGYKSLPRQIRF